MLTVGSIVKDAYYYERIGFRAAWLCVMQLPFIILLSAKVSIVGWLIGTSYERINWAHRWAARTLLICVTVHGGFFMREWIRADFLTLEIEMMPMVKYGMGSWCVLLWINISSLAPFRYMAHEFFVLQHLASAGVLLWLVHTHVPDYAYYYVWIAIAFIAFDRVARWAWLLYRNTSPLSRHAPRLGYEAELLAAPGNTTRITLKAVRWRWRPGQHVYLWMPGVGPLPFETHPFTLANACPPPQPGARTTHDATMAVRTHSGFTLRLHKLAARHSTVRAFVTGPYGAPPDWAAFDTLVLVAASTGASFTLPIAEAVVVAPRCVRRVAFLLCVRERPACSCYLARLRALTREARVGVGVLLSVVVWVTGADAEPVGGDVNGEPGALCVCGTGAEGTCCCGAEEERARGEKAPGGPACCNPGPQQVEKESCCNPGPQQAEKESCCNPGPQQAEKASCCSHAPAVEEKQACCGGGDKLTISKHVDDGNSTKVTAVTRASSDVGSDISQLKTEVEWAKGGRPDIEEFIRYPVEAATGETCVVVCGGKSLTGRVRNAVAKLSDERAVHKGSGAQGIMLHVEEFGF